MKTLLHKLKNRSSPRWLPALCLLVLVLQNLLIFWQHYTGSATFLNDFARIFYPMTAFWITLLQHGVFPEWAPFQSMGMPFVLTMQSGVFYPPLWLFAAVKAPFTLHMAVVVQVLHVLWGAIGCWLYVRLLGRSYGVALFAALAFQFFGGFYTNAEHSDIIRAFAFIPWLFWVVQVTPQQTRLVGRNWFAPLLLLLFISSAYQGNLLSHLFVLGIFLALSWFSACIHDKQQWQARSLVYVQVAALLLLAILMSSVYLWPTLALKSYLARDGVWTGQTMNWPLSYWNTLIMPSNADGLFVLPSMLSAFVTVPVFCLLFLVSPDFIKKNWLWVFITGFAFVMASGTSLPVYKWIINIIPPLGSSRFPSSDYRAVFGFGLILLSSMLLDDFLKGTLSVALKRRALLCLALLLFFGLTNSLATWLGSASAVEVVKDIKDIKVLAVMVWSIVVFASSNTISANIMEWPIVIFLSGMVFFCLYRFRQQPRVALSLLLMLEIISGGHAVRGMSLTWRSEVVSDVFYQELDSESPHQVMRVIDQPPAERPACHDLHLFHSAWRGYLLGDYMCQTQDSKTRPREAVKANPIIDSYMRQAWQARLVTAAQQAECQPETLLQGNTSATPIRSLSYGLQQINYQVKAASDFCFVENELLFPGWTGAIAGSDTPLHAHAYCGALRSWCLPKGEYQFTASYRTPRLREAALLSALFAGLYVVLYVYWRRRKGKK